MRLIELLGVRRILVPLGAATLQEGIAALVRACVADGRVSDPERLEQVIRDSRPEDTMSMGPHAWLPHYRTDAVPALVVALGVAPEPLPGPDPETAALPVILLVVAPPREAAAYLQTVAAFARALARPEVGEGLRRATSPEQVLALRPLADIQLPGQLLVRDIMTARVVAIGPDEPLAEAARLLRQHDLDGLPVVGPAGEVVGLLSHRELLRRLVPAYVQQATGGRTGPREGGPVEPGRLPVREVMARNVLCISEDQSVAEVAQLLAGRDVASVPVVRDGVLRGLLTRADIVRKVLGIV